MVGLEEQQVKEKLLSRIESVYSGKHIIKGKPSFTPGNIPLIWNLRMRNPHFTGRNKELNDLYESLHNIKAVLLTQAITGIGGIGKTQLALEYAHRYKSDYDLIWWVSGKLTK